MAKGMIRKVLGLMVVGAIIGGTVASCENNSAKTVTKAQPKPQAAKVEVAAVELTKGWGWTIQHDIILELTDVKIKNNTSADIKDVEIYCVAFAESGTRIDSNSRTQYKVIRAGQTLDLGTINMGFLHSQAYKQNCSIKSHSKA